MSSNSFFFYWGKNRDGKNPNWQYIMKKMKSDKIVLPKDLKVSPISHLAAKAHSCEKYSETCVHVCFDLFPDKLP